MDGSRPGLSALARRRSGLGYALGPRVLVLFSLAWWVAGVRTGAPASSLAPRLPGRRSAAASRVYRASLARDRAQTPLELFSPHGAAYISAQSGAMFEFLEWLAEIGVLVDFESLLQAPKFIAGLLHAFGRHAYSRGDPLYSYVCLLNAVKRQQPSLRAELALPWQLVGDWRCLEPTTHRLPTPAPLFRAMILLAIVSGWWQWAAVTIIAFVGPGRIGEILRATRECLVLPRDDLGEHPGKAFLQILQPKSATRGGARVQHISIVGFRWVNLLTRALGDPPDGAALYPFSASTYRARWDALLRALAVPISLRLTPGGLRGGGAVSMYIADTPIDNILWRMRIKDQTTLGHYLQEVAAISSLRALPAAARAAISHADDLFGRLFMDRSG